MFAIIPLIVAVGVLAWVLRPGKAPANSRRIAILATAIPAVIVAIVSIVFQLLQYGTGKIEVAGISNTLFLAGLGLVGASILIAFGFALARKGEIARGTGFGICISVVITIIELGLLEWLGGV